MSKREGKLDKYLLNLNTYFKKPNFIPAINSTDIFTDEWFPADENSLLSKDKDGNYLDTLNGEQNAAYIPVEDIEWKRIGDVVPDFTIFHDTIDVQDIKQGNLEICYFLSTLVSLCDYPGIIYQKFITKDPCPNGFYQLTLFIDGEWQIVVVDDYFPFKKSTNEMAFTKLNGTEIWINLLEKAWAKVNGGYSNIVYGDVNDAILALTGFIGSYYTIGDLKQEEIWKIISIDQGCHIKITGTKKEEFIKEKGLIPGHAYGLPFAKEGRDNGEIYKLIKLHNPWGKYEWNGDWSDESTKWTAELKKQFEKIEGDDGTFYIELIDYMNHFNSIYSADIITSSFSKFYNIKDQNYSKKSLVFHYSTKTNSKLDISIFFKNWRFNRHLINKTHHFSLLLVELSCNKIYKCYGTVSTGNDIHFQQDVVSGDYFIFLTYIDSKYDNFEYTMRLTSKKDIDCCLVKVDENSEFLQYLLVNKVFSDDGEAKIKKFSYDVIDYNITEAGLYSKTYANFSRTKTLVQINPRLTSEDKNTLEFSLLNKDLNKSPFIIFNLLPKQAKAIIVFKIVEDKEKFFNPRSSTLTNKSHETIENLDFSDILNNPKQFDKDVELKPIDINFNIEDEIKHVQRFKTKPIKVSFVKFEEIKKIIS